MRCPWCHCEVPAGKFCQQCGQPLTVDLRTKKFATPEAYTPPHLAEKILTSREALEGERKHVTILFADLKSSLELLADRDPEEARKILDPVLELMMEAVHRYEGTVNQVMGDGIMALFGAPVAHEDHAVRACFAALDMQAAVRRHAEEMRRRTHEYGSVAIRIGLNSGTVVVRAIGSDLRMDYTAVGERTHLASRMEQLATPGTTLLTADTLRLAEGYIDVRSLGPIPIKGLPGPVEVYELLGAGPLRSRIHAAAARGFTRFIGRSAELEQLRQALGRAAAGRGQVVAVVGEPGVGKSRLVWELTHSRRTHGWLVLEGHAVAYGRVAPCLPVVDFLRGYFGVHEGDDPWQAAEKVTERVRTLDRALEPDIAALLALLDLPVEEAAWHALGPAQRRDRTREILTRLLLRESRNQPVLLIVEDLHWIDSETQAVLDGLVERLPAARLLLLVSYRPEYRHGWGGKTYYMQLRLDSLPTEGASALLDALLGDQPSLEPLKAVLIERTEGNPFFLEESIRAVVESGVLAGERGAYRLERAVNALSVPATVQAVLAARVDRLTPEDKRLLQAAAVVGKNVPLTLLREIAEMPDDELRSALARLRAAELIYERHDLPDVGYTFKHALTHDVAYESLLHGRRRLFHTRLVEAIERLYAERLPAELERLAHHSFAGEAWEKAARYAREAAAKVYTRSAAAAEAALLYDRALRALGRLPPTRDRMTEAVDLHLAIRTPLAQLLEHERVLGHLREAERLAAELADRRRLGRVYTFMTAVQYETAAYEEARRYGARALELVTGEGDWEIEFVVRYFLAQIALWSGDHQEALILYDQAIALDAAHEGSPRSGVFVNRLPVVVAWAAICLAELGRFAEAVAQGERALRLAGDEPFNRVVAYLGVGRVHLERGDLTTAVSALEEALQLCHRTSNLLYLVQVIAALGYARALWGARADALALLETAVSRATARRQAVLASTLAWQGEALFLAGRPDEARVAVERARDLARERGERGHEARALHLLGRVALDREPADLDEAERHLRQGLGLAQALGMRPLLAHCHLGLGRLSRRLGDHSKAEGHLVAAATLYREMDTRSWLAQAESALQARG
jgi:class 3 adenylate cyclase/tetratricopeptide (TPR) repeat protein